MNKKMIGHTLTAVGIAGLALTGVTAAPASASITATCEYGNVCLYNDGTMVWQGWPVYPGNCQHISSAYNYVYNRSGITQRAWSGSSCTGGSQLVGSNAGAYVPWSASLGGQ